MQPCGQNCPRFERYGAKKEVCFAYRILFFHFFYFFFFVHVRLQCSRYNLNVNFLIIFKKFFRVHNG
jgi:hypothetical protein